MHASCHPLLGGVRGGLCLLPLAIPSWEGLGVGYAFCLFPKPLPIPAAGEALDHRVGS